METVPQIVTLVLILIQEINVHHTNIYAHELLMDKKEGSGRRVEECLVRLVRRAGCRQQSIRSEILKYCHGEKEGGKDTALGHA